MSRGFGIETKAVFSTNSNSADCNSIPTPVWFGTVSLLGKTLHGMYGQGGKGVKSVTMTLIFRRRVWICRILMHYPSNVASFALISTFPSTSSSKVPFFSGKLSFSPFWPNRYFPCPSFTECPKNWVKFRASNLESQLTSCFQSSTCP